MRKMLIAACLALFMALPVLAMPAAAEWANVETNKDVYYVGQGVNIYVVNDSPDTISYCQPTSFDVTNSDGDIVYSLTVITVCLRIYDLDPGQRGPVGTWNQKYSQSDVGEDGMQVPPGVYYANWGGDSQEFTIIERL